ncbi:hypothetical protein CALVIDRAFT_13178 [Calocera viscosa TUFC12733]|uniref:Uncharacterized protein n=1 Tax=Calocera viscosa (strain TUFC12733) TaxID=1330018 RepID=A0A167S6U5_CALVF|nr:hypothetical protein CALVIDRAFT_13178 [Calocera viscosa TUFC12733]
MMIWVQCYGIQDIHALGEICPRTCGITMELSSGYAVTFPSTLFAFPVASWLSSSASAFSSSSVFACSSLGSSSFNASLGSTSSDLSGSFTRIRFISLVTASLSGRSSGPSISSCFRFGLLGGSGALSMSFEPSPSSSSSCAFSKESSAPSASTVFSSLRSTFPSTLTLSSSSASALSSSSPASSEPLPSAGLLSSLSSADGFAASVEGSSSLSSSSSPASRDSSSSSSTSESELSSFDRSTPSASLDVLSGLTPVDFAVPLVSGAADFPSSADFDVDVVTLGPC